MGRGGCIINFKEIALRSVGMALLIMFYSCYNSFDSTSPSQDESSQANITIAELHTLYNDSYLRLFTQEWRVEGVITANNIEGNLYGSFIAEDNSYAIEILDGLTASHVRHVEGATVLIELEGLAMSRSRGVLQIGLPAADYSYYAIDYLSSIALVESHINIGEWGGEPTIESIRACELNENMCGRVLEITNLTPLFDEDELNSIVYLNGYRAFVDNDSSTTIYTYISSYADFAYNTLENNLFSITGVVQFDTVNSSEYFILKPRKADDIAAI